MDIVFFGSSKHSLPILEALFNHHGYTLSAIISQPAKPVGRKKILTSTPVAEFAHTYNIPLLTPEKLDASFISCHNNVFKTDLIIVAAFGRLIPKEILHLPKYDALNIHPSFLPEYRGASPAQWAILEGREKSGITIIKMSENFDEGKIVAQKEIPILPTDNYEDFYNRAFQASAKLLIEILPSYIQGKTKLTAQPSNSPTIYARKLNREDGRIDWDQTDAEIERKIRAFDPWPGTWTTLSELSKCKMQTFVPSGSAELTVEASGRGNAKCKIKDKRVKILKAHLNSEDKLQLDKLQIEGKKPICWEEFVKGHGRKNF